MDKTDETQFDKNEGNQLVINSNTGTINIHNHVKGNNEALEAYIESEKLTSKNISDFIMAASQIAKDILEATKNEKNKKNTRKQ